MSLPALPNELILLVAEYLTPDKSVPRQYFTQLPQGLLVPGYLTPDADNKPVSPPQHLSRLSQVNRRFSALLAPLLREVALRNRGHLSALAWAAQRGHEPLARLALDHGADADAATTGGNCYYTPLLWAVEGGNEDVLRLLLDRGAEVNLGVPKFTALHLAIENERDAMAELLLDRGADVELREDIGLTPLLIARCEKIVRLLLDHGADVDVQGKDGTTALHRAAMWPGKEAVVKLLLERGASVAIMDNSGMTARRQAAAGGLVAIEKLLLEKEH